jgi:Dolichyl-phosphate-mannose-protein mannosyltransferase
LAFVVSRIRLRWPAAILALVMAGFTAACPREAWLDAPTVDEPVYVAAGVLGAIHHDLTFNDEHPPLPKVVAALPVLLVAPRVPDGWSRVHWHSDIKYAESFTLAQLAAGKLRAVTFASRLVPIVEALAVGVILYRLGSLIFGPAAGAVAGVLWLADPVTIGLGHIDGVDLPLALAAALTSLALLRWVRRRDRGSLLLVGAATGLAVAAGLAGLVVLAAAVIVVAVTAGATQEWPERARVALAGSAATVVVALVVLWASYVVFDPGVVAHPTFGLPWPYVNGLRYLRVHDSGNAPGYLFGREWNGRRWWYWPAILLVKMPLPMLVVLVAGLFALPAATRKARREVGLAVALPAVALAAFTMFIPDDTGIRYLLPAIALLIVVASGVVVLARRSADWHGRRRSLRGTAGAVALVALLAAGAGMAASSFPHSLAWTTPPFTPGYRFASDSNVDWGQDFYLLDQWARGRHPFVDFHGGMGLGSAALFGARRLPRVNTARVTGWVVVSSVLLTGRGTEPPSWLRGYCPVGTLGGSDLIYRFRRPPSSSAPFPAQPPGLCSASGYSRRVTGLGRRRRLATGERRDVLAWPLALL